MNLHDNLDFTNTHKSIEAVVIGCSVGGLNALHALLRNLPNELGIAIIICAHVAADAPGLLPHILNAWCHLPVTEAMEREPVLPGHVYVAPPNYHLLIEMDRYFSLSVDERVCYVRPAIDVLFTSAADVYGDRLLGVLLTGANSDGTQGMKAIKAAGGTTLVQDPKTAEIDTMPKAAIAMGVVDQVLPLSKITNILLKITPKYCYKPVELTELL